MKKKTPAKLQAEYDSDLKKFAERGIAVDEDGKYLLYIRCADDPDGAMAFFFDKYYKRVRMCTSTFYRLLDEGKAVRVDHDDL